MAKVRWELLMDGFPMESNVRHDVVPSQDLDPAHIATVGDFSPVTLGGIVARLEVSTEFEHLVYREAELDAIWSLIGFFLVSEPDLHRRDAAKRLHAGVHMAHDLVAANRPGDAAVLLRALL